MEKCFEECQGEDSSERSGSLSTKNNTNPHSRLSQNLNRFGSSGDVSSSPSSSPRHAFRPLQEYDELEAEHANPVEWANEQERKIHALRNALVPAEHFQHTHASFSKVKSGFLDMQGIPIPELSLISSPINGKALVSDCIIPGINHQPTQRVGFFTSPVQINVSKARLESILGVQLFVSNVSSRLSKEAEGDKRDTSAPFSLPPRISQLVSHIERKIDVEFSSLNMSILADEPNIGMKAREVLLEESLHDFLSQCSTHLKFNGKTNMNLATSRHIFIDKMCGMGLSLRSARKRVDEVEAKFYENVEIFQETESNVDENDEDLSDDDLQELAPISETGRRESVASKLKKKRATFYQQNVRRDSTAEQQGENGREIKILHDTTQPS